MLFLRFTMEQPKDKNNSPKKEPLVYRFFGNTLGAVILFILEVAQIVVIALAIILPVRFFLIQPFIVKGASMEPNFYENEYLIIDEITYRFRDIERGEVVVLEPPTGVSDYYIKRVIGLPGETVEVSNGKVTIYNGEYPNGLSLMEDYIIEYTPGTQRITVEEDAFFVMGDNRDESLDSRKFGTVPRANIVGRVWLRGLPFSRVGVIDSPLYSL